jgi:ATP-binding cassette, subfamily B, multidrug efflux pump
MSADPMPLAKSDVALFRRLLPFVQGDGWLYAIALLAAPVSAVLVVVQPWLLGVAIDDYIVKQDPIGLRNIALGYLAAVIVAFLFQSVYTLTLSYAAMRTITRLRGEVYAHTLALSHAFHDRVPKGKLLTRATSDVEALGETLTAGAMTILLDALLVIGILGAMFALDARLTVVMVFIAPPLAVFIEVIRRTLRRLYLQVRTNLADLNAYLAERLQGVRIVQLYADEQRAIDQFDTRLYRYRNATIRTNVWDALLYATVDGLSSICMALMLWYGGSGYFESAITAGLLAAFIDYIGKLFTPIREFSAKIAVIQRASSALEKIFGLLDHDESIQAGTATTEDAFQSLVLDEVSFAYTAGHDVLKRVSLSIASGEVVAVVGRTGSGKTTLGKLLIRAYQGYTGTIRLNEHELSDLTLSSVRETIGMVHQDVMLFPGTLRFNLSLGRDIAESTLTEALRVVDAQDIAARLGGLDGLIEHDGDNLSVGEGQLLAFARTLAHDAPMVILDEATASVDSLTEARIQKATDTLLARKTVLVIAHRLSTIMHADRIVVLDAGVIVQTGSHHELLEKGGIYADLFHSQFSEA